MIVPTVITLLVLIGLFMVYRAATAPAIGPCYDEGDPVPDHQTYQILVQDWVLSAKAWVPVFSGSLAACRAERDRMYTQGHNSGTCRIVQVV